GALVGRRKWTTYSDSMIVPVIATGIRYFANLLSGTDWTAEENPMGGADAKRAVDIVTQGLLEAPMLRPWTQVVKKASMFRPLGFSLFATAMRRRPDGMVVFSAIEHRPQFTIERWIRDDETQPFRAVDQRAPESQRLITIDLDECFYLVDDTLTDSPEGVGLLRHVIEYVRRLKLFEEWEGSAYSQDISGTPIGGAPLALLEQQVGSTDPDVIKAKQTAATDTLRTFLTKRNKDPSTAPWYVRDTAMYANPDGSLTQAAQWTLDILKTETKNLDKLDQTIRRVELQIARVLGIEFALMGGTGDGSYAQHEDKTSMFATNIQTTLTEMGAAATAQLARRLVAANGLDPDTCTPRLVAEPVSTEAIETVTRALANLALAGLPANDPARNVLRKRMRLPPEPEQAYDLVRPSRLIPAPGDGTPPPGEAEVDPTRPADAKPGDVTAAPAATDAMKLAELRTRVRKEKDGWNVYDAKGARVGVYATKCLAVTALEAL
ncbi:MAG TPA: hypothetical protein VLT45_24630, partial [Kofleriaceae bacterium]|nr:hypothetical protein [Kofleriaceae bacterium]